ncbi:MAG: VOC family protein [Frankia sp.]
MALAWTWLVVDCVDPAPVARFWAAALGAPERETDEDGDWPVSPPGSSVALLFQAVSEGKTGKNRLHLDLHPGSPAEQDAEVERLIALGARRAQVGQTGSESWVILADPGGNEFCVLRGAD